MGNFSATVIREGIMFELEIEVTEAEPEVGYQGGFDIESIKFQGEEFRDILKEDIVEEISILAGVVFNDREL